MTPFAALLLLAAPAASAEKTVAYSAEVVIVSEGVTKRAHVWTDGVRWKQQDDDGKSGHFQDEEKGLSWMWGPGFPCIQMPPHGADARPAPREEPLGGEVVAGHPTKKFKVTTTYRDGEKTVTDVRYVWRATDLGDLAIRQRSGDGTTERTLRNVVLGPPDPKLLSFPSPQCHYDETQDTTRYAPKAAGGYRTIPFSDAGCKQFVPLPLTLSIPSDYAIRSAGPLGCFWGTEDDLGRALASKEEADFTNIRRGVFWCRASPSTEFDPVHEKFVSEEGPQEQWPAAMKALGARDVVMEPKTVGGIATLRVSGCWAARPSTCSTSGSATPPRYSSPTAPRGRAAPPTGRSGSISSIRCSRRSSRPSATSSASERLWRQWFRRRFKRA
jgi:hypothetical protein